MPTVSQHYVQRRSRPPRSAADPRTESVAPVVLMVSGGADSTALLLLACDSTLDIADGRGAARIARERLHVLHVNHHLRDAASDADEAFVRDLCARQGLPLCVEHASFEDLGRENLEAAARSVRYAAARRYLFELVEQQGCARSAGRIVTAHTASDRVETFFMNAIQGAGPAGLSSIPRRRNLIVRPLMDRTHDELCRYLAAQDIAWCEDETNRDTAYLRNFVRHRLLPIAIERNPNLIRTVASTCDIVGDEDAYMGQLAATALRACTVRQQTGLIVIDAERLAATEMAVARRMVRRAIKLIDSDARLEMRHIDAVLACVAAGGGSLTLPGGIDARREFGQLLVRSAADDQAPQAGWLEIPGTMMLARGRLITAEPLEMDPRTNPVDLARRIALDADREAPAVLVDATALGYSNADLLRSVRASGSGDRKSPDVTLGTPATGGHRQSADEPRLWVDAPEAGDIMCPIGMHGRSKKLSDLLGEKRIPVAERTQVPVVRTMPAGAVVWVAGVRLDERFRCRPVTRIAIRLSLGAEIGK